MATSEFIFLGFCNLGMKAKKSCSWVSATVNSCIGKLQQEVKANLKKDFENGRRYVFGGNRQMGISINNHCYLNVCITSA